MIAWNAKLPANAKANAYTFKGQAIPSALEAKGKTLVTTSRSAYRLSAALEGPPGAYRVIRQRAVRAELRPAFVHARPEEEAEPLASPQNGAAPDNVSMYVLYGGSWTRSGSARSSHRVEDNRGCEAAPNGRRGEGNQRTNSWIYDFFEDSEDGYNRAFPAMTSTSQSRASV